MKVNKLELLLQLSLTREEKVRLKKILRAIVIKMDLLAITKTKMKKM